MRLSVLLLVAVTALLSTTNAISMEEEAGKRSLRSMKTKVQDNQVEEERAGGTSAITAFYHNFDLNSLDKLFLPADLRRMTKEPEFLRHMMNSWKTGYRSVDDIVAYMTELKISEKAIEQFKIAYSAYIEHVKAIAAAKLANAH
ncbi:hypothetical protein P3T76_014190 [Phytophthora citrophthora]|uniref:RxLR effector protein n=1 Tax=Phytophthora citrophthora TaxID=4793 RepID=A0AAD9LBC2_9STRA|nr:hypothetical protein P3T76_014190 [Phytophthora citrophthora]